MNEILWFTLFAFSLCGGLIFSLFGLPGNWLMVILSAIYAFLIPLTFAYKISFWTVALLAAIAFFAELIEFLLGARGLARGGTKKGALFAVLGSIVGTLLGGMGGSVIPVVGTLFGCVFGGAIGAMIGAYIGEKNVGKTNSEAVMLGKVAFWGRLMGSLSKIGLGFVIALIAFFSALFG